MKLTARTFIPDTMLRHGVRKENIDERVQDDLSFSLAKEIDCYKRAVKRICTTLTSGWFRDFAIENYDKVIEWYKPHFASNFLKKVVAGEIKPKDEWDINEVPLIKNRGIRL